MNRRNLFAAFAAGAAVLRVTGATAAAAPLQRSSARSVATRDGERLHVQDWGRGRPLVFVHGWTMNCDFWERQTCVLPDRGLRCVAYDQRGCGRSSPAAFGFELDSLADDLDAVMRALDLRDAVLVGHSMGCAQIARYLTRHGDARVAKAVLTATTTPGFLLDPAVSAPLLDKMEQAMRADRPAYLNSLSGAFFQPHKPSPELNQWGLGMALTASLRAAIGYTRTNLTADLRGDLKSFTMPTLVVHGGGDASAVLALTGARTAAAIANARLIVYDDGPHGLPLTHAERLNRDLLEFVAT